MDCHADQQPGSPARCRGAETTGCTRGLWGPALHPAQSRGKEPAGARTAESRPACSQSLFMDGMILALWWGWGSGTLLLGEGLCSNLEPGLPGQPRGALWIKGPCNL